jgi:hypothetical protein
MQRTETTRKLKAMMSEQFCKAALAKELLVVQLEIVKRRKGGTLTSAATSGLSKS